MTRATAKVSFKKVALVELTFRGAVEWDVALVTDTPNFVKW